jgi:hypothetical protein
MDSPAYEFPRVSQEDKRPARERLLAMAAAARNFQEPAKRWTVLGLMHERYRLSREALACAFAPASPAFPGSLMEDKRRQAVAIIEAALIDCGEGEIFEAAYKDEAGRAYWQAWLYDPLENAALVKLLASHLAQSDLEYENIVKGLGSVLEQRPHPEPTRATVERLFNNPNTQRFVPTSLREYLSERPIEASPSAETNLPTSPAIERSRAGRKPKLDWDVILLALELRIEKVGFPDRENDDPKWRSRADVIRWAEEMLIARNEDAAPSTIAGRIDEMLAANRKKRTREPE